MSQQGPNKCARIYETLTFSYQSEGSERIIQVAGCDDRTGLGHVRNLVSASVVVAWLGAGISNVAIDSVSNLYHIVNA